MLPGKQCVLAISAAVAHGEFPMIMASCQARFTIATFSKKIALLSARLYQATPMQKQIFALAVLTLCTSSTFVLGATDTPETRRREAERYLQATPPKAMFEDMADKMAGGMEKHKIPYLH